MGFEVARASVVPVFRDVAEAVEMKRGADQAHGLQSVGFVRQKAPAAARGGIVLGRGSLGD